MTATSTPTLDMLPSPWGDALAPVGKALSKSEIPNGRHANEASEAIHERAARQRNLAGKRLG